MARTKDYDEYIDWTYDEGYDPSEYDSYEDYIDAVIDNEEPINYHLWDRESKKKLRSELQDFHREVNIGVRDVGKKTFDLERIQKKKEHEVEIRRSNKIFDKMKYTTKRAKREKGESKPKLTKTEWKLSRSIRDKIREGRKLNKTERNFVKKVKFQRAAELRKKYGYNKSDSLKRSHKELDFSEGRKEIDPVRKKAYERTNR